MSSKALYFLAASAMGAAMVAAQAAPNWQYIPATCATACAQTAQISSLCQTQYAGDYTNIYGCYCNAFPSDAASCATCLNSNDAAALGALVTSTITACPAATKSCFFQCSFDTCKSSDVACQCSASYLSSIYNCGSCNTANGNTGATQLKDWQNLQDSCKNQNYTGASGNFVTTPLASPTGQSNYVPVSLTAVGGGAAATGNAAALGITGAAGGAAGAPAAAASATAPVGAVAAVAGASSAAPVVGAGAVTTLAGGSVSRISASAAVAGASGAATASKAAANNLAVPATGLLAILGAVAALL